VTHTLRLFLLIQGVSFGIAGLVHSGVLGNKRDQAASIAESTIAGVLLAGFALTWVWASRTRPISRFVQIFALLGTLVGAFTIAIGIGPRSLPDIAFHGAMVVVLAWGLIVAARAPARPAH
jgi:hypothetical protein